MKRPLHLILFTAFMALSLSACNLGAPQATPNPDDSAGAGTIVAATSSIPTSTMVTSGNALPSGTLILTQLGNAIAQPPNANGSTIALKPEQFGSQASINGRYGVRFVRNGETTDLFLVDFSTSDTQGKEVPQGKGLNGPSVVWKADSSGFAIFEFPSGAKTVKGSILYYDVASGQTSELVPAPGSGNLAAPVAFSPDGKYLVYAVGKAGGEGIVGPGSKMFLFDTGSKQSTPLADSASGFNQWSSDSKTFIAQRFGANTNNQVLVFNVSNPNNAQTVTPANTNDFLADISPDGKFIAVTSAPVNTQDPQPAQIFIMGIDGSNRKALTKFTDANQSITGLVWGADGIYYSVTSAENVDTTWRMDLDGSHAAQVAQGTLNGIVGIR